MKAVLKIAKRFLRDEQGTEVLEWGLVAALIVVGSIVAIGLIGPKVKTMWDNINTALK